MASSTSKGQCFTTTAMSSNHAKREAPRAHESKWSLPNIHGVNLWMKFIATVREGAQVSPSALSRGSTTCITPKDGTRKHQTLKARPKHKRNQQTSGLLRDRRNVLHLLSLTSSSRQTQARSDNIGNCTRWWPETSRTAARTTRG